MHRRSNSDSSPNSNSRVDFDSAIEAAFEWIEYHHCARDLRPGMTVMGDMFSGPKEIKEILTYGETRGCLIRFTDKSSYPYIPGGYNDDPVWQIIITDQAGNGYCVSRKPLNWDDTETDLNNAPDSL